MKTLTQIGLLIVFSIAAAPLVYGCSCFAIGNKDEVEITDAIFTGKVVEISEDKNFVPPQSKDSSSERNAGTAEFPIMVKRFDGVKRFLIKFKVDKDFKGVEGGEITLVEYRYEMSVCSSFPFSEGEKYLVYASRKNEEFSNGGCSRTQKFDKKSKDYKELLKMRLKS